MASYHELSKCYYSTTQLTHLMICLSLNNHRRTRASGTVFAIISLLSMVTISKRCFLDVLFVQSSAYGVQSTIFVGYIPPPLVHFYQSIRYGLQSFKGCICPELLVQSSIYWIRSQSSKGSLFLPLMQLSVYQTRSTIIQRMRFSGIARAVICLLGMVTIIQEMPSSTNFVVDSLSDTVYNHPRDQWKVW